MKRLNTIAVFLIIAACAEQPVKLVIDPPASLGKEEQQNISYSMDDSSTGKKETVSIPVSQVPQKLVIEQPKGSTGDSLPKATLADEKFAPMKDGEKTSPSVSYLKGTERVQRMYQGKKYQDALINLAPLIEQYPGQPKLYTMQGTIYRRLGETRLAYSAYRKALELDKDNLQIQQAVDSLSAEVGEVKP